MSNRQIVKDELDKLNVFSGELNPIMLNMAGILDDEIPNTMKYNISNYALASFVGHFHTKVVLGNDKIPANFIGFTLAGSGLGKTSSVNKLEKALGAGYHIIEKYREDKEVERAKAQAEANDDENYLKYVKKLNPLFNSISTEAGIIKRLNDFKTEGVGIPSLFVDEISTELQCNADIIPNIKLVSELYDVGNKKSRALKDTTMQSEEVKGMAMSAMFIGSEAGILLDESVLKKFNGEFISKLARRVDFDYAVQEYVEPEYDSVDKLLELEEKTFELTNANAFEITEMSADVAQKLISNDFNDLTLSPDAERLYKIYKYHCKYESEDVKEEAVMLSVLHRHWRVLKLATTYAAADLRDIVEVKDLIHAISFSNLLAGSLERFIELSKRQDYEVMIDLLRLEEKLSIHELKKREILNKGKAETQVSNLIELANSKLGKEGMLKFSEGYVELELFEEVNHGASYKMVSGSKEDRAFKCKDGYTYKKSSFEKLSVLLSNDTSYCAFEYSDGVRSNDNICSSATFVVLDIDDSEITWTEAHDMLADFNHHVAQTSDANNPYKFRVLVELDIGVDLDARLWKNFMAKVGEYLGLSLDLLAKSQQYYGFKGREVFSVLDAEPLPASELIKGIELVPKEVKRLPRNKVHEAYEDRFEIFKYAYEVGGNTGAAAMFRAFKHAHDLGFEKEQVIDLLQDICDYRDTEFDAIMKRTGMMNQINRSYEL